MEEIGHGGLGMKGKKRVCGHRLNSAAAAEYLGITERTLRWMRTNRKIAYHRIGRECVYDVAELERVWKESLKPCARRGDWPLSQARELVP